MKFTASCIVALVMAVPGLQACGITENINERCYSAENQETPQNIDKGELDYMIHDLNNRGDEMWTQTNCAEWNVMKLSRTQALTRKYYDGDVAVKKSQIAKSLMWIRDNCGTKGGAKTAGDGILVKLTNV